MESVSKFPPSSFHPKPPCKSNPQLFSTKYFPPFVVLMSSYYLPYAQSLFFLHQILRCSPVFVICGTIYHPTINLSLSKSFFYSPSGIPRTLSTLSLCQVIHTLLASSIVP